MKTGLRMLLGGLAVAATGLAVSVSQSGVFAAVGSNSVSVALASAKVSAAAGSLAAIVSPPNVPVPQQIAALPAMTTPLLPQSAVDDPAMDAALPSDAGETSAPLAQDDALEPDVTAALPDTRLPPVPNPAVVPTPVDKPDMRDASIRPLADERSRESRRQSARNRDQAALAAREAGRSQRRISLKEPLPIIIGAYR